MEQDTAPDISAHISPDITPETAPHQIEMLLQHQAKPAVGLGGFIITKYDHPDITPQ